MHELRTDHELLAEFARTESETAFATLVERDVNLVYSTALRFTGNPHHAEEITQAVFIILARKAGKLSPRVVLSGWLYQAARLTSANLMKGEIRRRHREQEAYMQTILNEPDGTTWKQIAPLLDEAMGGLGETDRDAVVLRFFENKTAAEVAGALKLTEAAAHKRLNRALEKLRKFFKKRGVSSTTTIIVGAISANSVQAAPVALAKSVTVVAISKGAAVSGSTLTLINGALKFMAWTKAKTASVICVGILLAAGTTTITVKEIQEYRTYPWQVNPLRTDVLNQVPPQVRIVPTKFPQTSEAITLSDGRGLGTGYSIKALIQYAYAGGKFRTILSNKLPQKKYDFIANLTHGSKESLQLASQKKFGVIGRHETRETEVLLLKVNRRDATGLKVTRGLNTGNSSREGAGVYSSSNQPLPRLAGFLENYMEIPVLDQTGLTNNFDINIKWNALNWRQNPDGLRQAILNELGLELVSSREPIDMLVVEKAK